jgi:tol-pal system protein YbgF
VFFTGCTARQGPSQESEVWRIQSLEENFLNFKERQRASEERLKRHAQELSDKVRQLEEQLQVMHMEMQAKLDKASMNKNVQVIPSPDSASGASMDANSEDLVDAGQGPSDLIEENGGDTPFTGAPAPASPPVKDSPVPMGATSDELYNRGMSLVRAERYVDGREVLNEFLAKSPNDSLTPNALYWLGESYYGEKRFAQAILTFKEVIQKYPKHHKAAASLLKIGFSYEKLGDNANARFYLQALLDEYPASDPARLARKRLRALDG